MFKWVNGPWDVAKGYLRADLEHLESAINQRHTATFTDGNTLKAEALPDLAITDISGTDTIVYSDTTNEFLEIVTVDKGLKFPATQVPSANVNTLDDYEEGVWVPTDGSGAALSLTVTRASYVKLGKQVIATAQLSYPATADGTNSLISGLPFPVDAAGLYPVSFGYNDSGTPLAGYANTSSSNIFIYASGSGTRRTNADLTSSTMVFVSTYWAAN